MNDVDLEHLRRAVDLAEIALEAGEEPYGSVLVGADGTVLERLDNIYDETELDEALGRLS